MNHTHIGFTGTRKGMTQEQQSILYKTLAAIAPKPEWFHHGDCIGADEQAHVIARHLSILIHLHPPINTTYSAGCIADQYSPPQPYLVRNHHIADASTLLLVAPATMKHTRTGGTWATFRYARQQARNTPNRTIIVIWPDGTHHTY